jgi:hypothetical protein
MCEGYMQLPDGHERKFGKVYWDVATHCKDTSEELHNGHTRDTFRRENAETVGIYKAQK